jgi:Asp-tRNA(Asn)/Glu-tRNA(Gln) amidotransferase A subunit family amidase
MRVSVFPSRLVCLPACRCEYSQVPFLADDAKIRGESNNVLAVKVMKYIFIANLLGLPGYSVPVGFVPAAASPAATSTPEAAGLQLPVGLHFLGNHWEDHKVRTVLYALHAHSTMLYWWHWYQVCRPFYFCARFRISYSWLWVAS